MDDLRETERIVGAYLDALPVPDEAQMDTQPLADALAAMRKAGGRQAIPGSGMTWKAIMKSRASKLVAAAVLVAAALAFSFLDRLTRPVWALSETIEAIRGFGAVHMVGTIVDEYGSEKGIELWMRANKSRTGSKDVVARLTNGVVQWVQDDGTCTYIPQNNTVYHEDAITAGAAPWIGPALLEQFQRATGSQTVYGTDPVTGGRQVTLLCSLFSSVGPQSFSISFDL
jgi:hypothetical protein